MKIILHCLLICFPAFLFGQKFKLPDQLNEVSGIIYASADSILYINDGGNAPAIFTADSLGNVKSQYRLPNAINRDWEDLSCDDQDYIYVGDFGNNRNMRQDLTIYKYHKVRGVLDSILFHLPDQFEFPPNYKNRNFDIEAFFWAEGYLNLFSKSKLGNGNYTCRHYRLKDSPGQQTAEFVSEKLLKKRVVTSAAISPDKSTIALLSYHFKRFLGFIPISKTTIFLFQNSKPTDYLKGEHIKVKVKNCIFPSQYESIDFINKDKIIIASERTSFLPARGKIISIKK